LIAQTEPRMKKEKSEEGTLKKRIKILNDQWVGGNPCNRELRPSVSDGKNVHRGNLAWKSRMGQNGKRGERVWTG